jgi:hypothetical protein
MKKIIVCSLFLIFSSELIAEPPEVISIKKSDGLYAQYHKNELNYWVDIKAQMCFVVHSFKGGTAAIDCNKLFNRAEWQSIITWVKPTHNKHKQQD